MSATAERHEIVRIGQVLYERRLVGASDGNLSIRLDDDRFLITPSGRCKGWLEPSELLVIDASGQVIDGHPSRPSSELAMHLTVYHERPDAAAVVHAHPPHVVALSFASQSIDAGVLPEALIHIGIPAEIAYALPASTAGAEAIRAALREHEALVLARHGSLTFGRRLEEAYFRTESLEQLARTCWLLKAAGMVDEGGLSDLRMSAQEAAELLGLRRGFGLASASDDAQFRAWFGDAATPKGKAKGES